MKPQSNIFWAIIALTLILQGVVQAESLRNNPEHGSGFYLFICFFNSGLAVIAAMNITSAVRKLMREGKK